MFEKLLAKYGYIKGQAIRDLMSAESQDSVMAMFGDTKPENYDKFLKAYADEVWVYACVYTIANAIAGLPIKIYRDIIKKEEKVQEEIIQGGIIDLMQQPSKDDPNLTWYNLMEFTMASLELTGNGYWLQEQVVGRPVELLPLISSRISIEPGKERFIDKYVYKVPGGKDIPYEPEIISHFKYMNPNDNIYGLGSFSPGKYPVTTYKEMIKTNLNIFHNGAKVDGFLKTEKKLDDKVFNHLLYQFNLRHKGTDKAHKIGLLEQGLEFQETRQNLKELEYTLGVRLTREDICAVFGVPPLLVGILDKATYANYKESVKILYKLSIIPKLHRIKPIIDNTIIKKFDKQYYMVFDLTNVEALKEDEVKKSVIAKNYFSLGIPVKQLNKKLDLGIQEYPGWDIGYLPIALVPIGSSGPPAEEEEGESPKGAKCPESESVIKITEEWKKAKWEKFNQLAIKVEKAYHKIIDRYFTGQEGEMIARLDRLKTLNPLVENTNDLTYRFTEEEKLILENTKVGSPVWHNISKELKAKWEKAEINVESILFNEKSEIIKWSKQSRKVHTVALEESGKRELQTMGIDIVFDTDSVRVRKWLDKYGLDKATEVIGNERQAIKETLLIGVRENESIPQLKKRLRDFYQPYKKAGYKAERMARTEVIGASNQGALEAYVQSDVVEKKGWLSEPDARDTHLLAAADYGAGKEIPVDEDFVVGSGSGPAPGQMGVAEEDVNCRCSVYPKVKK